MQSVSENTINGWFDYWVMHAEKGRSRDDQIAMINRLRQLALLVSGFVTERESVVAEQVASSLEQMAFTIRQTLKLSQ